MQRQQLFGYTHEDLRLLLAPMATNGEEALGSMGTDTSLAALSDRPRLLFDYFKQVFAQVTNPPLDAIREELVTSMESTIGPGGQPARSASRVVPADRDRVPGHRQRSAGAAAPRLRSRASARSACRCCSTSAQDGPGLERALDDLKRRAADAVDAGYTILILSDRDADRARAPIPSLLATAGVHHHLVRHGKRTRCALVVESGDAREVHHCALLLGYGAGAVNPYLAFETLDDMIRQRILVGITHETGGQELHQGAQQGHPQGDVEDGHLDAPELLRRAGVRSDRPRARRSSTSTSRAPRRGSAASASAVIAEEVQRRHEKAFPSRPVG